MLFKKVLERLSYLNRVPLSVKSSDVRNYCVGFLEGYTVEACSLVLQAPRVKPGCIVDIAIVINQTTKQMLGALFR